MKIIDRKFLDVSTPTCHASSVAFYKGEPVYAWFGGSREGSFDCAIYIQWGDHYKTIGGSDQIPRWNPILFPYEDRLFLFVKMGEFCDRWQTLIYDISDKDLDQLKPQDNISILPAGLNGPVKTKPIVDKNGNVLCGSSVETKWDWASYIETYNIKNGGFEFIDRSSPLHVPKQNYVHPFNHRQGLTTGIIQPSLWIDNDDNPHAFFRSSYGLGKIYHSKGRYKTKKKIEWTKPYATKFENPNSGVDTVYMDGNLFLIYNPSDMYRYPLVLSRLDDDFNLIEEILIGDKIADDEKTYSYELSYPYMVENDGKIYLTYTYGRSRIELVTIEI